MKTKLKGILTLFLAFFVQLTFAQEKTISGNVTDNLGLPLPGVNIVVKGTTNGTQTDFDGNYTINANVGDVLVFSYIGQKTENITVGSSNVINVVLLEDASALDEVVVTALGIKRKKDQVTSAYQEVNTEELVQANNPSVVNSLSGKVSGLTITQNTNGVSGGTRIVLRGDRSISGDNQALVVINGAISNTTFLNALDPNQIETVNVIKGAAGSALYGSQGSNGVIVVTTKKGSKADEKMTITVNSSIDVESVAYVPEKQTRYGQGWDLGNGFENVIYENGGWGPEFDGQIVPVGLPQADGTFIMAPFSSRGKDSMKDFFDQGLTTQNSITFSSGSSEGYFNLGVRHLDTEFVVPGDKRKRNTFTLDAGKTLGKWSASANIIWTNTTAERHNGTLYEQLLQSATNIPITAFANSGNEGHWNAYFTNPYWNLKNQREKTESNNISLAGELQYEVNKNISVRLLSQARVNDGSKLEYQNAYAEPQSIILSTGADRSIGDSFKYDNSRSSQYYTDLFVNLDYMLTDDISFAANLGLNNQYFKTSFARVSGSGLTVPGIYSSFNVNDILNTTIEDNRSSRARIAAIGNVDFGYKDFLYLNITARNDWSSTLSKSNQSFFYPSTSVSFIPTKAFENFGGDFLNYLKLTAAYVEVGNDGGIGAYAIQPVVNPAPGFPLGGQNSFIVDQTVTNPFLEPEFIKTQEFGLSAGFLKDRITLDASYSIFQGENQITSVQASAASGIDRARINIAETEGSALELDLGLKVLRTQDLSWDINVGYSTTENKVLKVTDDLNQVSLGGFTGFAEVFAIKGEQFPVIQSNAYERDPQGRILVDPANGNLIEAPGLSIQGRTTPKHVVNLNTQFRYKGFTIRATMDYRTGHVFYSDTKSNLTWSGHAVETAQGGRGAFIFPNSAIEVSPGVYEANTSVPSASTGAGSYINFFGLYRNVGENHVLDATAFKVRELSLSYELSQDLLKNSFITGLRISATARNPIVILPAENRGYNDPESGFTTGNAQGITAQNTNYPPTRTFGLGVNLTF